MFNDVDETLKQYFTAELPISPGELDVSFERPTREWSGRLSRPTLNCFMYDIRERKLFRDEPPAILPNGKGGFLRQRAAPRIDLTYMITAWAREADDEHRILARTLAAMYRSGEIPERHFQGALVDSTCAVLARIETSDHLAKPADMWGVLDNELHTSLVWVITAPLEAFAPVEGPIVRTRELRFGTLDEPWRETNLQVAGTVYKKGDPSALIAGVQIALEGTAMRVTTGEDGRFAFPGVQAGERVLRFESGDGRTGEQAVTVPSASYDIEL